MMVGPPERFIPRGKSNGARSRLECLQHTQHEEEDDEGWYAVEAAENGECVKGPMRTENAHAWIFSVRAR